MAALRFIFSHFYVLSVFISNVLSSISTVSGPNIRIMATKVDGNDEDSANAIL